MALLPDSRSIFLDVTLATVKRILAGAPVRVIPLGEELLICARNFEELILVEPRVRKDGSLGLGYALRDPQALADRLDLLRKPVKEQKKYDYRAGKPRRLGRAGKIA
jgi:hypothetical protein